MFPLQSRASSWRPEATGVGLRALVKDRLKAATWHPLCKRERTGCTWGLSRLPCSATPTYFILVLFVSTEWGLFSVKRGVILGVSDSFPAETSLKGKILLFLTGGARGFLGRVTF